MKNSLPILVMPAMLAALPASPAWSQNNDYEKCMNDCLESPKKYGDEDIIKEAIRECAYLCNAKILGDSKLGSANSGMSSSSKDKCLRFCSKMRLECLQAAERTPKKCRKNFDACWKACLQ